MKHEIYILKTIHCSHRKITLEIFLSILYSFICSLIYGLYWYIFPYVSNYLYLLLLESCKPSHQLQKIESMLAYMPTLKQMCKNTLIIMVSWMITSIFNISLLSKQKTKNITKFKKITWMHNHVQTYTVHMHNTWTHQAVSKQHEAQSVLATK